MTDYVADYRVLGYAVVKGVFDDREISELGDAFDRIRAHGLGHPKSFRHGNVFFRVKEDANLGRILRYMQWPAYIDPVLDRYRLDRRLFEIIRPLVGDDVKQIINQMHWKPPGAAMHDFGYHQDIRFRRPRDAYRDPAESYVQTGIAIDAHRAANGAMTVFPGSHRLGELDLGAERVMDTRLADESVEHAGLSPRNAVALELDPGDVALWHLHTVHGSGANTTSGDRRLYINGYVRAENCDRGEWTFREGAPVPLGEPVLVHYEDLFVRPEPHYVDD